MSRAWSWGLLSASLLLVGCGGDEDGAGNPSAFVGSWAAQRVYGTNTCTGEYESEEVDFMMRLRAGGPGGLQYVSLAADDPSRETCVQDFSVDGNRAVMTSEQPCMVDVTSFNPDTGQVEVVGTLLQTYLEDELVVSGDSLHEQGVVEFDPGGGPCRDSFELDFVRAD